MTSQPSTATSEMSFEQALTALQEVVAALEEGNLTLDETIATFQAGSEIASRCQEIINAAELRVSELAVPGSDSIDS